MEHGAWSMEERRKKGPREQKDSDGDEDKDSGGGGSRVSTMNEWTIG